MAVAGCTRQSVESRLIDANANARAVARPVTRVDARAKLHAQSGAQARAIAALLSVLCVLGVLCASPKTTNAQSTQYTFNAETQGMVKGENRIIMRPFARVDPGAAITLGDIASLKGPIGSTLASVVVLPVESVKLANRSQAGMQTGGAQISLMNVGKPISSQLLPSRRLEITIAQVRSALAARDSSLEGKVLVSGSISRVLIAPTAVSEQAASTTLKDQTQQQAVVADTVRSVVIEKLAGVLGVPVSALRAEFEPTDNALLDTSTKGRVVAASPTGTGARIGVTIHVYESDRVVANGSIRVGVKIRRQCAVAIDAIGRGQLLDQGMYMIEERDVAPGVSPANIELLSRRSTRVPIAPGQIIEARHVESPVVVSRGDVVTIECVAGSIVLKTFGRAKGTGREGDIVAFEPMSGGRRFEARVAGPGRAVALTNTSSLTSLDLVNEIDEIDEIDEGRESSPGWPNALINPANPGTEIAERSKRGALSPSTLTPPSEVSTTGDGGLIALP